MDELARTKPLTERRSLLGGLVRVYFRKAVMIGDSIPKTERVVKRL